ncbi:hypothetical protein QFC22_006633 [Naganishia vaughanmartiniae]|uniref:Uncharacterized protein n=1 Tax=Naganishia vaughanmartiniae TaxID=1424756 RepID=A0ACC2WHC4_9TREE|nr:hypothetical protein QFC22_006633 [Naganishia vaughanmartiniae]
MSETNSIVMATSEKAEHNPETFKGDALETNQHEQHIAIPILTRVEAATANTNVFPAISTYKAIILVSLVMVSSMMQVASGIGVSITIADIGHDLKIPSGQLQWVASAGSLATACTLLVSGKLADMYGHKPVFVIGCIFGGAMFLGMGLARDKYQLFIFRALGGVAFSGVTPAAIGLIGTTFPEGPAKSRAFAGLGAGAPVGTAIGLVLAGITTQYTPAGWRTFFWICAGLSCALAIGATFVAPGSLIPRARTEHTLKGLDWIGVILSAVAIFCIVFPLGEGGNAPQGWKTPFVWIVLGSGIVFSVLFVLWERRLEKRGAKPPLMRMSMWNRKMFASLMLADLCLSGAFTSMLFISRTSAQSEQGQGGSIFSTVVAVGGALMLAISTIVSDRVAQQKAASLGVNIDASKTQSAEIPEPALLQGYRAAFWTCFGLGILAAFVVGVFLRKMGTVGRKKHVASENEGEQVEAVREA